jgi:glycosyltransferase involved in cell wall biosynthesis
MLKISVVIGTYNQRSTLELVLEALFKQSLKAQEYEIILVDSLSNDGTDAMIEQLSPPCRLNYLRRENQGKSAARNFAVQQASAPIILLTDADMVADPHLLVNHLKIHQQYPNVAVEGITCNLKRLFPPDELFPEHPEASPYIQQRLKPGQKLKWSYFLSGNLSLRKAIFEESGGFDENFRVYGWEDIELGYRLAQKKIPLIYNPAAVNYHYHIVSQEGMLERKYNMGKSAAYFYKKHPNFTIKMFLGMNPLAMGIFYLLKRFPSLLTKIKNQYILEEYNYRLGLTEGLQKSK